MVNILDLNVYILMRILDFCDDETLNNLYYVSDIFHDLIERLYLPRTLSLLMCSPNCITNEKTRDYISNRDRIIISTNWRHGYFNTYNYFTSKKPFASKILLEKDYLYMSQYSRITIHKRLSQDEALPEPLDVNIERELITSDEIRTFVKTENEMFTGGICGKVIFYDNYIPIFSGNLHYLEEDIMYVNFKEVIFVTGTKDRCQLWKKDIELGLVNFLRLGTHELSFNALKFLNSGTLIGGLARDIINEKPLREINIERNKEILLNTKSYSIFDLAVKDSSVLYTSNCDQTLRIYDRRLDNDVCKIQTHLTPSYIEHDGLNAILCAMRYDPSVFLYDIRRSKEAVAQYCWRNNNTCQDSNYICICKKILEQSAYGIACDCRYLFVSVSNGIKVFDFKLG